MFYTDGGPGPKKRGGAGGVEDGWTCGAGEGAEGDGREERALGGQGDGAGGEALGLGQDHRGVDRAEAALERAQLANSTMSSSHKFLELGAALCIRRNRWRAVPKRAEGFDWSAVLPGNTSETVWSEYLTFNELPQVMNPKSGFIQNCNNTPFITTTGDNNPTQEKYSKTFGIESRMSNRALRALELFGQDHSISASEFKKYKIAVNALWSKTAINTAAISMLGGYVTPEQCRKPEIVSDAAYVILSKKSTECTGNFFIDELVLKEEGENNFDKYAVKLGSKLFEDLYLD